VTWPWRKAIIVGASSGIGAELAKQLVAGGCRVALVARREAELAAVAESTTDDQGSQPRHRSEGLGRPTSAIADSAPDYPKPNAQRPTPLIYPHDVTCYEEVPSLFQRICRDLDGLDLIVYSAGYLPRVNEDEYSFEKDRVALEVNLLGAVAWLDQAADRFGRAGAGTIVGISSVAGDRGRKGNPVYNASKAGLNTYLEALRMRLQPKGVTVLTAKPGFVTTPMTEGLGKLPMAITAPEAARRILEAARDKRSVAYIPSRWRPIMFLIRNLPARLVPK